MQTKCAIYLFGNLLNCREQRVKVVSFILWSCMILWSIHEFIYPFKLDKKLGSGSVLLSSCICKDPTIPSLYKHERILIFGSSVEKVLEILWRSMQDEIVLPIITFWSRFSQTADLAEVFNLDEVLRTPTRSDSTEETFIGPVNL